MKKLLFTSPSCGPCKLLKGDLDELGYLSEYKELDVTQESSKELIAYCGIRSVPALVVIGDSEEIKRVRVGYTGSKDKLLEFLADVKQTELERRE